MKRIFVAGTTYLFVLSIMFSMTLVQADSSTIAGNPTTSSPISDHIKVQWSKEYDPKGMDELHAKAGQPLSPFPMGVVVKDGLAIVVAVVGFEEKLFQTYFIKLDENGSVQWQRALGDEWISSMVEVQNGYVLSQSGCLFGPNGSRKPGVRLMQFDRNGKLANDWCGPISADYKRMFSRGNEIDLIRDVCVESTCSVFRIVVRVGDKFEIGQPEALLAKVFLPKAPKDSVRTSATISHLYRLPQGWLVDLSVHHAIKNSYAGEASGWLHAFDDHAMAKWNIQYPVRPAGPSFLRNVISVPGGYLIAGSTLVSKSEAPEAIPATANALRQYIDKTKHSPRPEYRSWVMRVDDKGHIISQNQTQLDLLDLQSAGPNSFVGYGPNNELAAIDDMGKSLWQIKSPVQNPGWSTVPELIIDGEFIWMLGNGEVKLFTVAKARIETKSETK